jgi:disulfide oxidoreductase YuzD
MFCSFVFLPEWFKDIKDLAETVEHFGVVVAAAWGLYVYRRDVEEKRLNWIRKLWTRYYMDNSFKDVRADIIWKQKNITHLKKLAEMDTASDEDIYRMIAIDNYLNFFEFIALLKQRHQLKIEEVEQMFGGTLDELCERDDIRSYLADNGYTRILMNS